MVKRFMRLPQTEEASGLKRSAIYKLISEGTFPKPIPITGRAVAWDEDEVLAWQKARIAQREQAA
jgi:prophage regulatory protein